MVCRWVLRRVFRKFEAGGSRKDAEGVFTVCSTMLEHPRERPFHSASLLLARGTLMCICALWVRSTFNETHFSSTVDAGTMAHLVYGVACIDCAWSEKV